MANRSIHQRGCGIHEEALASGILSPGHLIKLDANGAVLKHATEGGYAESAFAKEQALLGKSVDDAYAVGDLVPYVIADRGDIVSAIVLAGTTYAKGDILISDGAGALKKASAMTGGIAASLQAIAVVETAITVNATAGQRTSVRVL